MVRIYFIILLYLLSYVTAIPVNKNVTRLIDASKAIIKVTITVKAANVDDDYVVVFPDDLARHLSFLSVSGSKGKQLNISAPVT